MIPSLGIFLNHPLFSAPPYTPIQWISRLSPSSLPLLAWDTHLDTSLGDGDRLLFHGFMYSHLVLDVHLVKLINATHTLERKTKFIHQYFFHFSYFTCCTFFSISIFTDMSIVNDFALWMICSIQYHSQRDWNLRVLYIPHIRTNQEIIIKNWCNLIYLLLI